MRVSVARKGSPEDALRRRVEKSGGLFVDWDTGKSAVAQVTCRTVVRGGKTCPYCGETFTQAIEQNLSRTVDHVWPRSRFPEKCNTFLVDVCRRCNGQKGNYTLSEWHEVLVRSGDPRGSYVQRCMTTWKL